MTKKSKKKEAPKLDLSDLNKTELRQILFIQLNVRVSRAVSIERLLEILETSEVASEELDPLVRGRKQLEGWLAENWQHFSNQLRCTGKCSVGGTTKEGTHSGCTDIQVMACLSENLSKVQ